MTDALLPLSICVALGLLWHAALRARERAIAYARRLCAGHGAQMLDQSVALQALRPLLRDGRLRLVRRYGFELSYAGDDRHAAQLTLVGGRLLNYSLPLREGSVPEVTVPPAMALGPVPLRPTPAGDIAIGGNVIPIERGRRTLH